MDHYPTFYPRQAMRGNGFIAPANRATIALFNNSTAGVFLVVRKVTAYDTTGAAAFALFNTRTRLTGTAGTVEPVVADGPILPGLIDQSDQASASSGSFLASVAASTTYDWPNDYPLAIVPPNYSVAFQSSANAHTIVVSYYWEALYADQLAPYYKPPT